MSLCKRIKKEDLTEYFKAVKNQRKIKYLFDDPRKKIKLILREKSWFRDQKRR